MTWRFLSFLALLTNLLVVSPIEGSIGQGRIWFEYGVAQTTGGFDAKNNRTLINKWYIAAFGPDDIATETKAYVQQCVRDAVIVAVHAFQTTPGEVAVKLSAAYGSFQG